MTTGVTRETILRLAALGPGWHAYALAEAEQIAKADPITHGGLVAEVCELIGADDAAKARKALDWFERHPAGMGA